MKEIGIVKREIAHALSIQGHDDLLMVVDAVKSEKVGQRATARPQLVCGKCGSCLRGQYNACQELKVQGFQVPGVAQFAKARGAKKVLITDVSDFKLNLAGECGIEDTLNILKTPFDEGVKAAFGSEGYQVGFEAAGVQASLDALIANVEKGGEVIILGVYAKNPTVNMYFVGEHELSLSGSMMYRHEDYEEAAKLISEGKIVLDPMVSKHFLFEQYPDAYNFIGESGDKVMKVMIYLS